MREVLPLGPTEKTVARSIVPVCPQPQYPGLGGQQQVEELQQERGDVALQAPGPDQAPCRAPVSPRVQGLASDRTETWWGALSSWRHENLVLQQQLVPLAGGEYRDVEGTVLMIVEEQGKEVLAVVGGGIQD